MDDALQRAQRQVCADPADLSAWLRVAHAYAHAGRQSEAYLAYSKAGEEAPETLAQAIAKAQKPHLAALHKARPRQFQVATTQGEPPSRSRLVRPFGLMNNEGWEWRDVERHLEARPVLALHARLRGRSQELGIRLLTRISKLETVRHLDLGHVTELHRARGLRLLSALPALVTLRFNTSFQNLSFLEATPALLQLAIPSCEAEFEPLRGLRRLHELRLNGTLLGADSRLDVLATLQSLKTLVLGYCGLSNHDLPRLEALSGLERLDLAQNPIDDEGLRSVGRMTALTQLNLRSVRLTDTGLAHLAPLQRLERLDMDAVTDAGLAQLAKLTPLRRLRVAGRELTDNGLEHLHGLKHLAYLDLNLCDVSEGALERLRAAVGGPLEVHRTTFEEHDEEMDRAF